MELGRVSRDSTGFRAMEEVLISSGGRNLSVPLVLAQESPIFHSICEGELAMVFESQQGKIDLIYACVQDLVFHYWADRDLRVAFSTHPESQASSCVEE